MQERTVDQRLLDAVAALPTTKFEGQAWRHMFGDNPPELANTGGARWNPAGVDALYASLERETAIAEGDFRVQLEPIRPRAKRTVYRLSVRLAAVVDLTNPAVRLGLGLTDADLADLAMTKTAAVGGAVEWLGYDGVLVPSIRTDGVNLVIFPNRMEERDGRFDRIDAEVIFDPDEE
jgi:RES domain-containing protein